MLARRIFTLAVLNPVSPLASNCATTTRSHSKSPYVSESATNNRSLYPHDERRRRWCATDSRKVRSQGWVTIRAARGMADFWRRTSSTAAAALGDEKSELENLEPRRRPYSRVGVSSLVRSSEEECLVRREARADAVNVPRVRLVAVRPMCAPETAVSVSGVAVPGAVSREKAGLSPSGVTLDLCEEFGLAVGLLKRELVVSLFSLLPILFAVIVLRNTPNHGFADMNSPTPV